MAYKGAMSASEDKDTFELATQPATKLDLLLVTQNIDLCFTILDRISRDIVSGDREEIEKSLRLLGEIRRFIRKNTDSLRAEINFPTSGIQNDENGPEGN